MDIDWNILHSDRYILCLSVQLDTVVLLKSYHTSCKTFCFLVVVEIDSEQFPTLAREELCDMLRILSQNSATIAVWSKITGMVCIA